MSYIDGAVILARDRWAGGTIQELDTVDGGGSVEFAGEYQLLRIAITIIIIQRQVVGRCGSAVAGDGQSATEGAGSLECDAVPGTVAVAAAAGTHFGSIVRKGLQPGDEVIEVGTKVLVHK